MKDYADTGLTIQEAILDRAKSFPDPRDRPSYILWRGLRIKTADAFEVAKTGFLRGELLSASGAVEQGFEIKLDGYVTLPDGRRVQRLQTWFDPRREDVVEYSFSSRDGRIQVWNVYKRKYGLGEEVVEAWTGNAGFWTEKLSESDRIYHCSYGTAEQPDFDALVFRVTVYS